MLTTICIAYQELKRFACWRIDLRCGAGGVKNAVTMRVGLQGYGTVRDIEDTEVAGEKPVLECTIADCGELPQSTDLACIPTFVAQVG